VALGMLALLAAATPASAARWWYLGKTAEGAFLYLDGDFVIRDHDKYVVLNGKTIFAGSRTDSAVGTNFQAFVGCVEGLDVHYYRRRWVDASDQELHQDAFERFGPDETALAQALACTEPMSWHGRGFELVADPLVDAAKRKAQ
jgi:hypothetical protein